MCKARTPLPFLCPSPSHAPFLRPGCCLRMQLSIGTLEEMLSDAGTNSNFRVAARLEYYKTHDKERHELRRRVHDVKIQRYKRRVSQAGIDHVAYQIAEPAARSRSPNSLADSAAQARLRSDTAYVRRTTSERARRASLEAAIRAKTESHTPEMQEMRQRATAWRTVVLLERTRQYLWQHQCKRWLEQSRKVRTSILLYQLKNFLLSRVVMRRSWRARAHWARLRRWFVFFFWFIWHQRQQAAKVRTGSTVRRVMQHTIGFCQRIVRRQVRRKQMVSVGWYLRYCVPGTREGKATDRSHGALDSRPILLLAPPNPRPHCLWTNTVGGFLLETEPVRTTGTLTTLLILIICENN